MQNCALGLKVYSISDKTPISIVNKPLANCAGITVTNGHHRSCRLSFTTKGEIPQLFVLLSCCIATIDRLVDRPALRHFRQVKLSLSVNFLFVRVGGYAWCSGSVCCLIFKRAGFDAAMIWINEEIRSCCSRADLS